MKFRKFLTYSLASVCVLSAIPFLPAEAITMEQIATNAESIDVYFNDDGEDLTALSKDGITATLDGSPLVVEDFAHSEQRLNYMFLLDISASVPEAYMTAAKEQILSIYANLGEDDLLSVITFGDDVHTIIDGTETLDEVKTILDGVHCDNDYTHFYDAVDLMIGRLEGTSDMRNIAVVVSDGINTGDVNTSVASLQSRLSGSGIAIYALAVDAASPSAINSFRNFVQLSGGQLFTFSPETCADSMTSLTNSVDKIWNVGLQVDPALITGAAQELVIQIGDYGTITQEVVLEQREIDTTAPTITNWELNPEAKTLTLFFSEAMADLKNPEHYIITDPAGNVAAVTVAEHTEDSVVLMIEGFDNAPGWRAEFSRLMDASPNRNLLDSEPIVITPEIVEVPDTPDVPEEPTPSEFNISEFILNYWQYILAGGICLLALILYLVLRPSRKKKEEDEDSEEGFGGYGKEDSGIHVSESSDYYIDEQEDEDVVQKDGGKLSRHDKIIARSKQRARSRADIIAKRREKINQLEQAAEASEDKSAGKKAKKRVFRFLWFRKAAPEAEGTVDENNAENADLANAASEKAAYNENYGGVMMSKGSSPIGGGAAPMREAASVASADSVGDGEVHVNEHKHERRRLINLLKARRAAAAEVMEDDDLGIAVNEPLRGVTAPTRKDNTLAEDSDEYVVDKVSKHRRAPRIKRVRKGWFTFNKKDFAAIPEREDVAEETAETTEEEVVLTAAEQAAEEVSEKTARKYIKTKKQPFWKRKKEDIAETEADEKASEAAGDSGAGAADSKAAGAGAAGSETAGAGTADEEDVIDKKTARKYIKPSKRLFKKKTDPMLHQAIPERAAEAAADGTEAGAAGSAGAQVGGAATGVAGAAGVGAAGVNAQATGGSETVPKKATIQKGAIKSGGFSLSGISADYRPSIFTVTLSERKSKNDNSAKAVDKKNEEVKEEPSNNKPYTSSVGTSMGGSAKNVSFTFKGNKKK